MMTELYW